MSLRRESPRTRKGWKERIKGEGKEGIGGNGTGFHTGTFSPFPA